MWPLESFTSFFKWFDLVTYFLIPHDPVSNLSEILSRTSFWACLKLFGLKMWPLECLQGFSIIWSGHLLFDPKDPVLNLKEIWSRTLFWASLKLTRLKMWLVEHSQAIADAQRQTGTGNNGFLSFIILVHVWILYSSKFVLKAESWWTNAVVIMRFLCIKKILS